MITPGNQNKAIAFDQRPRPLHGRYTRTEACVRWGMAVTYQWGLSILDPQLFYTCFYNHAHRLRLEKLL